jgi:hypothetical protein
MHINLCQPVEGGLSSLHSIQVAGFDDSLFLIRFSNSAQFLRAAPSYQDAVGSGISRPMHREKSIFF